MIRRHMQFFNACGCAGSSPSSYVASTPCPDGLVPATGTTINDNRYFGLATTNKGQVVLVPKGSNAQHFLTAGFQGFLWFGSTGEVEVTRTPALALPVLNPAVSNVFPAPSSFKYLHIGTGSDPAAWYHVAAPTAGTWILQAASGSFQLVDAGQIPGLNEVGGSATYSSLGVPLTILEDPANPGQYLVRKMTVIHERLVQGWVDPDSGAQYYRPIPTTTQLKHPLGHFMGLQLGTFEQIGPLGNIIPGGMEQAVAYGAGGITDGHLCWYSPANKKFYKVPAHTKSFSFKNTNDVFAAIPGTYTALPGGHLVSVNPINISYPTVRVDFALGFNSDERCALGLYRDGVLVQEFNVNRTEEVSLFYVEEGITLGPHFWDVRWKKDGAATGGGTIQFSSIMVTTLP